jgi:hypothetical protein
MTHDEQQKSGEEKRQERLDENEREEMQAGQRAAMEIGGDAGEQDRDELPRHHGCLLRSEYTARIPDDKHGKTRAL